MGARYYVISWGLSETATGGGPSTSYNTQRYPSPNSTDGKSISMSSLLDDTTYYVKVMAGNSFGESIWSTPVQFKTSRLPDATPPQAVGDLRVVGTGESGGIYSVTLRWTEPYDVDRLGDHVNVSGYDIKYSANPILATTLEGYVDWNSATSVDPAPTPGNYGTMREVTVSGISAGTVFFAIKSEDTTPNWSSISNVTGVQPGGGGGGGGAGGYSGPTTIEAGWNIIATGRAADMLLDSSNLHETGHEGTLSTGDLIYQHIIGTSDFNMAYLSTNGWKDALTETTPEWGLEPDRGYFYMNRGSQFIWTRP
jgi:hypothetical protein